jgi:chaperonin GroES
VWRKIIFQFKHVSDSGSIDRPASAAMPHTGFAKMIGSDPRQIVSTRTKGVLERSIEIHSRRFRMRFRPLQDRVLIRRIEAEVKTRGGIIIPDTAKEKPQEGEVIALGPGKVTEDGKLQPMAVKVGDKILFGKYSGSEVKLGDEEYLIMREEDVLGILQ